MKFFENVLSEQIIKLCEADRTLKFSTDVWRVSNFAWSKAILVGITGTCASTDVSPPLKKVISSYTSRYFPAHDEFFVRHYVWLKGSGLSRHNDGDQKFGATIYLNRTWSMDHGGIFMWEPDASTEVRAACPAFNTMILNDGKEPHWVTAVSEAAPEYRVTLQIWGR